MRKTPIIRGVKSGSVGTRGKWLKFDEKNLCEKSFESKIQEEKIDSHERSAYPLRQLALGSLHFRNTAWRKLVQHRKLLMDSDFLSISVFFSTFCAAVNPVVSVWIENEPVSLPLIKKNGRASLSAVAKIFQRTPLPQFMCAVSGKVIEGESLQTETRGKKKKTRRSRRVHRRWWIDVDT